MEFLVVALCLDRDREAIINTKFTVANQALKQIVLHLWGLRWYVKLSVVPHLII